MGAKYIPNIQEAIVPEGGSWIKVESNWVLALFIPEWEKLMSFSAEGFRYVWMYDRVESAYLFCFKLKGYTDHAIAFPSDHVGSLLQDKRAESEFGIILTTGELKQTSYLFLKGIQHKQYPGIS